MPDNNLYSPPATPVETDSPKVSNEWPFLVFGGLVLSHAAVWASSAPMYWELTRTGVISILHFGALGLALLSAIVASLRILFRSPPPVVAFSLAAVFGLVTIRHPILLFELTALVLAVVGTVASLTLRSLASSRSRGFRSEV